MAAAGPPAAGAGPPARTTTLGFAPNMRVCLVPQTNESGGVLLFEKNPVDGQDILRCTMVCTTQGEERGVAAFGNATSQFKDRKSLMIFHTHPRPTPEQAENAEFRRTNVLLLSSEDLLLILHYSFVLENSKVGGDSRATHLLGNPDYMLFTRFGTSAFNHQLRLVGAYRNANRLNDETALNHYFAGMTVLFRAYETHMVRHVRGRPEGLTSSKVERSYVDDFLNNCTFAPGDRLTTEVVSLVSGLEMGPYLTWAFRAGGGDAVRLPSTEGELPGLFNSWYMDTAAFIKWGRFTIPDNGKTYDNEEHFERVAQPLRKLRHAAGDDPMKSGETPERLAAAAAAAAGAAEMVVAPGSPHQAARGPAGAPRSPASPGEPMRGGGRTTVRHLPSAPTPTVRHPSFSKHRPSTRRRLI